MDKTNLRQKALEAIDKKVHWTPAWGRDRIYNMIETRPDWCISRQRIWGVPILALICKNCDTAWYEAEWARSVADKFAAHPTGCDYWFENEVDTLAPPNLQCPSCGKQDWRKETDILDVWFDSGASFAAVVEPREECTFPADLYLEGSDQHRGWFHSSLLISIGTRGCAPYKSVLTHGYVVDKDGKKMSKSLGNVTAPQTIIEKHGAEILRLWVSAVDYREDIRISDEILSRLIDAYRRLRNTCRYILGNISDLTPDKLVSPEDMDGLDRFAWHLTSKAHSKILEAYREYEFHKVYHTLHNLCATELSSFYLDILKDRLYASAPDSLKRRSAQTAMYHILMLLMTDMAPILSFMAEEVFKHLPETLRPKADTVFALRADKIPTLTLSESELTMWEALQTVRGVVTKAIEPMRKTGEIGHSLDSHVTVYAEPKLLGILQELNTELRATFIVSALTLAPLADAPADAMRSDEAEGVAVSVAMAEGEKCARCWIYNASLNSNPAWPGICPRCTTVLNSLQA
jgi:isoleucyl-tRNA synthetase